MDAKKAGQQASSAGAKNSGAGGAVAGGGANMVAPGSGGAKHISRDAFESNTKKFFDNLHSKGQDNK